MHKPQVDLTISVTHWNTPDLLVRCLDSIRKHAVGLSYEVIITDNASTVGNIRQIAKQFPHYQWIFYEDNRGGAALNDSLRIVRGRYVLFLGPDVQVLSNTLQLMVNYLDAHPEAGAVTAFLLNPDGSPQFYYRRLIGPKMMFFCRTKIGRLLDKKFLDSQHLDAYYYKDIVGRLLEQPLPVAVEVEQPAGACLMIRANLLRDKNGYVVDPSMPLYFSEVDQCKRIYDAGYRIFVLPYAKVIHNSGSAFAIRETSWKLAEATVSMLAYLHKHYRGWAWIFRIYLLLEALFFFVYFHLRCILTPGYKEHFRRARQSRHQVIARILTSSFLR